MAVGSTELVTVNPAGNATSTARSRVCARSATPRQRRSDHVRVGESQRDIERVGA